MNKPADFYPVAPGKIAKCNHVWKWQREKLEPSPLQGIGQISKSVSVYKCTKCGAPKEQVN